MDDLMPFSLLASDDVRLHGNYLLPNDLSDLKAILQIVHGMGEHSRRYAHVAANLVAQGYGVYTLDLRGHGRTGQESGRLGYMGPNGFMRVVEDVVQLDGEIRTKHPDLPVFLLGHSMGSVIAVHTLSKLNQRLQGLVLSGTVFSRTLDLRLGCWFAGQVARRHGDDYVSPLLASLVFDPYNRAFRPSRTKYDWLSRHTDIVDAYVADAFCGHPLTAGTFRDFFKGLLDQFSSRTLAGIRPALPVYIFSGALDPVGKKGKSVERFVELFKQQGFQDVEWKLYSDGRHEMLNEINRDEVKRDLISWLNAHTPSPR